MSRGTLMEISYHNFFRLSSGTIFYHSCLIAFIVPKYNTTTTTTNTHTMHQLSLERSSKRYVWTEQPHNYNYEEWKKCVTFTKI